MAGGANVGLVPIAEPQTFSWPGYWIARVHAASADHAVVMFGSPSGPLHDPHEALARGGEIAEGWLLARLDIHLPIDEPYGSTRASGSVAGILVAADAEAPMVRVDEASAVKGRGLEGDRYYDGNGTFSKPGRGYELTLVDADVLQEVGLTWEDGRDHRHPGHRSQRARRAPVHGLPGRVHRPTSVRASRTSNAWRGPDHGPSGTAAVSADIRADGLVLVGDGVPRETDPFPRLHTTGAPMTIASMGNGTRRHSSSCALWSAAGPTDGYSSLMIVSLPSVRCRS